MVFWLAVLVGGLFAWMAVRIGFYAAWILFFHLLLATYMAIFLAPAMITSIPATTALPDYGYAMTLVAIAVATMLIAYGTCAACLSGNMRVPFPPFADTIVAGIVGFASGFLICGFVVLVFCLTPIARLDFFKRIGFDAQTPDVTTYYVCWWCDRVHSLVSPFGNDMTGADAVAILWEKAVPPEPAPPPVEPGAESQTPAGVANMPPPPPPTIAGSVAPDLSATAQPKPPGDQRPDVLNNPFDAPNPPLQVPGAGAPDVKSQPAEQESSHRGPLSGIWEASTGATFRIEDDERTATIRLEASDSLRSMTGRLVRRDDVPGPPTLTGLLDIVFSVDSSRRYTLDVTATLIDPNHLRIHCGNWPKWSKQGKYSGKGNLIDTWLRKNTRQNP